MGLNLGKQAIKACFYKALAGKRREKNGGFEGWSDKITIFWR